MSCDDLFEKQSWQNSFGMGFDTIWTPSSGFPYNLNTNGSDFWQNIGPNVHIVDIMIQKFGVCVPKTPVNGWFSTNDLYCYLYLLTILLSILLSLLVFDSILLAILSTILKAIQTEYKYILSSALLAILKLNIVSIALFLSILLYS